MTILYDLPEGTKVCAKVRTEMGISKIFVEEGKEGKLITHYIADEGLGQDGKERYLIDWGDRDCAGSHFVAEIEVVTDAKGS